ncbi:MAG: ferrous iron transport protein A [Oscillatoriales cyanobacterium RM2_1_1]|nr:ferrous iron transport protein A [Oscillatoriales cyanobacterium RM2_1_1]
MQVGEQGIVSRINPADEVTAKFLKSMGVTTGKSIILEKRFPQFQVKVENHCWTLSRKMIQAIYVRVI